jgi:hypothetical protein
VGEGVKKLWSFYQPGFHDYDDSRGFVVAETEQEALALAKEKADCSCPMGEVSVSLFDVVDGYRIVLEADCDDEDI